MGAGSDLLERFRRGDRAALARLITWAENDDERFGPILEALFEQVGRAWRLGITGPPGAGKSSLVNELARALRETSKTVGVLAVDPSSPFTGGALLGDRIRMEDRTLDPGVFIRSMASRDSHGGLARASVDACDVMDAFGLERILIETVGVGQAEYDVMGAADCVLVVLCPGAGDGIQAMKSGLLEVADIVAVNKCDLPGAERLVADLEEALHVRFVRRRNWEVPIVPCSAATGEGIERLLEAVVKHRGWLESQGLEAARRLRRLEQVRQELAARLTQHLWSEAGYREAALEALGERRSPREVSARLLSDILGEGGIATRKAPARGPLTPQ